MLRIFKLSLVVITMVLMNCLSASAGSLFSNPGFESPATSASTVRQIADVNAGGWKTTHPLGSYCGGPNCRPIEFWSNGNGGFPSAEGGQHIELNAFTQSMVFQSLSLAYGDVLHWSFLHRGRDSDIIRDVAEFRIGIPSGLPAGSLPGDSYNFPIVTVATTRNGAFDLPTGSGTINSPVPIGNGWVRYSGSFTYLGTTQTVNIGFLSVSAAGQNQGVGNFIDDAQVDRNNPCCPPWTPDELAAHMLYQGSGGIASDYTLVLQQPLDPVFANAMQTYIEYLHASNTAITSIVIEFTLYDQGTFPVPPSLGNGTAIGINYSRVWTAGSGVSPVSSVPPFFPGFPMHVGTQYMVHSGIYLNSGLRFFPAECDNNDIYVRIIAPRMAKGANPVLEMRNKKGQVIKLSEIRTKSEIRPTDRRQP
ncbi:MAG: hypothetical protein QOK48_3344 [Blastocatellia bacterium]|nr:hypothetical protein [Blastocatellia bacterium]